MGGCCCCPPRVLDQNRTPTYYYCPRVCEEHQPLSGENGATSAFSTALLVDTNLDTSSPDTYRPPPIPIPYDLVAPHPDTQDLSTNKHDCDSISKEAKFEGKDEINFDSQEVEVSKSDEEEGAVFEEEDVCPVCLEEYDVENPKIVTKCDHHFHLSCILEWMERKERCPVCDKVCFDFAAN